MHLWLGWIPQQTRRSQLRSTSCLTVGSCDTARSSIFPLRHWLIFSSMSVSTGTQRKLYLSHLCFQLLWSNSPVLALQFPGKLHFGATVLHEDCPFSFHRKFWVLWVSARISEQQPRTVRAFVHYSGFVVYNICRDKWSSLLSLSSLAVLSRDGQQRS